MDIEIRIKDFLDNILEFNFSYDTQQYIRDNILRDSSRFEVEQCISDYPIKGGGVIASISTINAWSEEHEALIHPDNLVDPVETSESVSCFPLDSVSIVYIYSLLEEYGNDVCDELGEYERKGYQSWHSKVYASTDLNDPNKISNMKNNFCKVFGFDSSLIPDSVIISLIKIKSERNKIVHELEVSYNYYLSMRHVVLIACCIYFYATGDSEELKVFPWYDHEGDFS